MEDLTANTRALYNQYRFGTFNYGGAREAFEPLLFELLAQATAGTVLFDIGCGSGYWLEAYLRCGIQKEHITCIDIAPTNIEQLQRKGFDARVGNALDLPVEDNVSDLTVCIGVIHHTDDPFKAFGELVRITRSGGCIYVNVYNKFHPYYYLVHRATLPIRYLYWNWNKRVADAAYRFARVAFQPLAYLVFGKFLDEETGRTMFMDQVITPRAHLFSKSMLAAYAGKYGCTVERYRYNRYRLMLSATIRVK